MIASPTTRRRFLLVLIAISLGALAFGLWHIVVGGVVNGNRNAAAFGIALASASTGFLIGFVLAYRRKVGSGLDRPGS